MLIDSHAHFDLIMENVPKKSEEEILNELKSEDIAHAIQISIDAEGLQWSRDFAIRNGHRGIKYAAGIHPNSVAGQEELKLFTEFVDREMAGENRDLLFGIGECGLDYFRMHQPREVQIKSFEHQIEVAKKHDLPLIIHTRDSLEEGISMLQNQGARKGIMHCFSGDEKIARDVLDLGFFVSFAGNVTYKNAKNLHEAAKYVPIDRMLLETDSPFLAPVPKRGKDNFPWFVKHTYQFVAELKDIPLEELEEAVFKNLASML